MVKKRKPGEDRCSKVSKARGNFAVLAERSLNLLALKKSVEQFLQASGAPKDKVDPDDIPRAAVVMAVAAMDSYFTDVFEEKLVPFLKNRGPTRGLANMLTEAGLDVMVALQLLQLRRPYRRVRSMIESFFEKKTVQQMDVIDKLFAHYGIKELTLNAEKKTKKRSLRTSVRKLVERRNAIAHDGDRNAHGKFVPIKQTTVERWIKHMVEFVTAADEILGNLP